MPKDMIDCDSHIHLC